MAGTQDVDHGALQFDQIGRAADLIQYTGVLVARLECDRGGQSAIRDDREAVAEDTGVDRVGEVPRLQSGAAVDSAIIGEDGAEDSLLRLQVRRQLPLRQAEQRWEMR